jgi:DNA-binding CsgD family transcriptional regulator
MFVYLSVLESGCQSANDLPTSPLIKQLLQGQHGSDRILRIDLSDQRFADVRILLQQMLRDSGRADTGPQSAEAEAPQFELTDPKRSSPLTPREREVLSLSAEGHSYVGIATALKISVNTVRYHMKRLNMKLDVHNRVAAIHKARTLGVV